MGNPTGPDPFPSNRVLLDQALESERGIKVRFDDHRAVHRNRMNCYTVIARDMEQAKKIYPEEDPRHYRTPYSVLTFRMEDDEGEEVTVHNGFERARWLVIRKGGLDITTIVEL